MSEFASAIVAQLFLSVVILIAIGLSFVAWRLFARRTASRGESDPALRTPIARIAFWTYLVATVIVMVLLLAASIPNLSKPGPVPSPTSTPPTASPTSSTPTAPPSTPGSTPPDVKPVTIWKYDPDKFQDVSGNWKPKQSRVAGGPSVYALTTRTTGCGASSLRQIRYWSLPKSPKTLQFHVGFGLATATKKTPISGKVQSRTTGGDWSKPKQFVVAFGETERVRFDSGAANEVLVSLYPSEGACTDSDVTIVYWDAQMEFPS